MKGIVLFSFAVGAVWMMLDSSLPNKKAGKSCQKCWEVKFVF
jgi:hypothetical protein